MMIFIVSLTDPSVSRARNFALEAEEYSTYLCTANTVVRQPLSAITGAVGGNLVVAVGRHRCKFSGPKCRSCVCSTFRA